MEGARAGSINIPVGIGELLLVDFLRAMELGDGAYIERQIFGYIQSGNVSN